MTQTILLVVQVITAISLVGFVLLQQGKGAEAGASFGGGASQTVFGSSGTGSFLTRTTSLLALIFFATSLGLAHITKKNIGASNALNFELTPAEANAVTVPDETALEGAPIVETEVLKNDASLPKGDLPLVDAPLVSDDLPPVNAAPVPVVTSDEPKTTADEPEVTVDKTAEMPETTTETQ